MDAEKDNGEESNLIKYSIKEKLKILDYLMNLRSDYIKYFFRENKIQYKSKDTRMELLEKVEEAIDENQISYGDIVGYLSFAEPLNKQHIFLYDSAPTKILENWRKKEFFEELIEKTGLKKFVNAPLPILAPLSLSISSIQYTPGEKLEIYALGRIEHLKRKKEHDKTENIENEEIIYKALTHRVDRHLIRFEWDLTANTPSLHISQLPSGYDYNAIKKEFEKLIKPLIDLETFPKLTLRRLIKKLHKLEENDKGETRSHDLNYQSSNKITYSAKSPSNKDSALSDDDPDKHFRSIRDQSAGHIGNFFWLPNSNKENPLLKEVHTMILGEEGRINFFSPNRKEDIYYVLSRVRRLSK